MGVLASATACGGVSDPGDTRDQDPGPAKAPDPPAAVAKFASQLQGCVDGEATGPANYGGAIGAKQTTGLSPVAAVEDSGAQADFLVFRSEAEAREAARTLGTYRQTGGKTDVRGLVLVAHKRPLGDLRCLETARRAAGPALRDAPPAPSVKLTAAQRAIAERASEVVAYCKTGESPRFEYKEDAEEAVQRLLPLLERAPDAAVNLSGSATTVRAIGEKIEQVLGAEPCLDPALTGELATAAP